MLIINADDFGRSAPETDVAIKCYHDGRITSVSTMVFMADSERAAELVQESQLDVGLHLNFSETFTGKNISQRLVECQERIVRYLRQNKYSQLLYNPFLRIAFSYSCQTQMEEFCRLYGRAPSRVDGHHHMHLCANVLLGNVIPAGTNVRRNFSFWPGEKSWLNRVYRRVVDRGLARKYRVTDYFFDLTQCIQKKKLDRVVTLAKSNNVELMTHPIVQTEADYLMSDEFGALLERVNADSHALV